MTVCRPAVFAAAVFMLPAVAGINLNTATADELMLLEGVGQKRAEAVIAYRMKNGDFESPAELADVPEFGAALAERLAEDLTVEEPTDYRSLRHLKSSRYQPEKARTWPAVWLWADGLLRFAAPLLSHEQNKALRRQVFAALPAE